jgi:hypothetical protein
MRLNLLDHTKHNWFADKLLKDFKVEDVWLLPIQLDQQHSLDDVFNLFLQTMERLSKKGFVGLLFKFRLFLGKIFNWDKDKNLVAAAGDIRDRYLKAENAHTDNLIIKKIGSFTPVYFLENECLLELDNKTVQACLHLSKFLNNTNYYTVHMTVYVNPKGNFGKFYMLLIKPFRLYIVYPSLLKALKIQWNKSKS